MTALLICLGSAAAWCVAIGTTWALFERSYRRAAADRITARRRIDRYVLGRSPTW